jgi:hypothetical protein
MRRRIEMVAKKIMLKVLLVAFFVATWPFLFFCLTDVIDVYVVTLPDSALAYVGFGLIAIGVPVTATLLVLPKALPHTLNIWIRWILSSLISAGLTVLIFILIFYFLLDLALQFHLVIGWHL